ncbi:RNA polymerase sigma factor [Maricaulis sp. CAU 1757]
MRPARDSALPLPPGSRRVGQRRGPPAAPVAGEADPDQALMQRIGAGDAEAARQLMQSHLPRLLGLGRRMLGDADAAEDMAQDTFLRVWKAAGRWRAGEARVSTWMTRIAMNICIDRLRRRRELTGVEMAEPADRSAGPELHLVRSQGEARLLAALAELPERQRQAIELVHYQETGNIAAAEVMQVSVEALESLLSRGRRRLRERLVTDKADLLDTYADPTGLDEEPSR